MTLSRTEGHRRERLARLALARQCRVVDRVRRLHLFGIDHDVVHHRRRRDPLRVDRAARHDALHLRDHHAAAVARRRRDLERAERRPFVLHRDIAVRIGARAAHDRCRAVVAEVQHSSPPNSTTRTTSSRAAAFIFALAARVDERVETDPRQHPGAGRRVAQHVEHHAEGRL